MLSHIEVENYQSIKHASLPLGRFTVIVGQTDSGKSALTRAIRTLTSNTRGDSFITTGERLTVIKATTDRGRVILRRGSENDYTLHPESHSEQQKTFTKLNAQVPEEVSAFLGIAAKDPINYAGQFDTPYLLKSTGAEVARTLGELTNVDVIFRAAAESNRQRKNAAATLKVHAAELDTTMATIETYRPLKAQREAITAAQEQLTIAARAQEDLVQLYDLESLFKQAEHGLEFIEKTLTQRLPDIETITTAQQALTDFLDTIKNLQAAAASIKAATTEEQDAITTRDDLEQQYFSTLTTAGTCPTCSQDTTHLHQEQS
jgi:DNA repair ATPase RecN